jgi:hypothetical protein
MESLGMVRFWLEEVQFEIWHAISIVIVILEKGSAKPTLATPHFTPNWGLS